MVKFLVFNMFYHNGMNYTKEKSLLIFLRIKKVSDKSCRENHKTLSMFSMFNPKIMKFINLQKHGSQTSHRWEYNIEHRYCMLDNSGDRYALRIIVITAFSTANMVTRTYLNIIYLSN